MYGRYFIIFLIILFCLIVFSFLNDIMIEISLNDIDECLPSIKLLLNINDPQICHDCVQGLHALIENPLPGYPNSNIIFVMQHISPILILNLLK